MTARARRKIVEVEWDDHTMAFGEYSPNLETNDISRVTTVGYFVREDDNVYVVAMSLSEAKPQEAQIIDKRMLRRARVLRPARR